MRRPLPRASTIWLGIIGGAAALDWYLDRGEPDGDTCSELIRRIYFVHTPLGKTVFGLTLLGGTDLLWRHITKPV